MGLFFHRRVILQDAPQHTLRLEQSIDVHYIYEDADHCVASVVESLAPQQKLDDVLSADLLVVLEEDGEGYLRLYHVLRELCNGDFGSIVQFSEGLLLFLHLLFLKQGLAVVAVQIAQDRYAVRTNKINLK